MRKNNDFEESYAIVTSAKGQRVKRARVSGEICYGVIGIRETGTSKAVRKAVLDHLSSGLEIASFRDTATARAAVRELIHLADWKRKALPKAILPAVKEIVRRHQI